MKKVIIGLVVLMVALIAFVVYASNSEPTAETETTSNDVAEKEITPEVDVPEDQNPTATIKLSGYDEMTFELYPMQAPQSVYNFISLADSGFYDGLTMHRLVKDFVIQGGDPDGNGTGGPGYSITGEFASNGYDTGLTHEKGSLAWARSTDVDSAGSQFYINLVQNDSLDGDYAVFGNIIEGEDVIDEINADAVSGQDQPAEEITIESITIDTKDIEYPEPSKIE